jgi:hypothetical protein
MGGLDPWSVTGMALLLFIALLALLCSSIRAKLTRREHAPDRLLNMSRISRRVEASPQAGRDLIDPRYGEMLPS